MAIYYYSDESFTGSSQLDPVDSYVGNGVTSTFVLINKSVQRMSSTAQANSVQYYQYNGGFTKDTGNNSFTLSSVPPLNSQIVAPGISQLVASVFDQNPVDGVTNPLVSEVPFWMGDSSTIHLQYYTNLPQASGIQISMVQLISGTGAELSFCQFACADPTTGLAMTYGATGGTLSTGPISAFGTLTASAAAGASSIFCGTASAFYVGDYVILNIGSVNQEIRKIASKTTSSMTFSTAFDFSHVSGETVYACGRKFWLKTTMPLNFANNLPVNYYNLGLRRRGRIVSRV